MAIAFFSLAFLALLAWGLILVAMFVDVARGTSDLEDRDAFLASFKPKIDRIPAKRTIDLPTESPYTPAKGSSSVYRFVAPSSVTPRGGEKPASGSAEAKTK